MESFQNCNDKGDLKLFCLLMGLFAADAGYSILQRGILTYKSETLGHFTF